MTDQLSRSEMLRRAAQNAYEQYTAPPPETEAGGPLEGALSDVLSYNEGLVPGMVGGLLDFIPGLDVDPHLAGKKKKQQADKEQAAEMFKLFKNMSIKGEEKPVTELDKMKAKYEKAKIAKLEKETELLGKSGGKSDSQNLARERFEYQKEKDIDSKVQKHSNKIDKDVMPGVSALQKIDELMPGGIDGKDDIEMYGPFVPDIVRKGMAIFGHDESEQTEQLTKAVQTLFNETLKLRSGAAVSDKEMQRLALEFGKGKWDTPQDLRKGVKRYRELMNKKIAQMESGADPKALERYKSREGSVTKEVVKGISRHDKVIQSYADKWGITYAEAKQNLEKQGYTEGQGMMMAVPGARGE